MRRITANGNTRLKLPMLCVFVTMTLVGLLDLVLDAPNRLLSVHFAVDLSFVLLCLGVATYLFRGWHRARRDLMRVEQALAARADERDAWREQSRRLREGLGAAIDAQLMDWNLTRVERQTAFLLLKGYSHKEIARLTERSDRTVRQHAVDIYRKSGMSGRAELSAFFLEDMLLPIAETGIEEDGLNGSRTTSGASGKCRNAAWCPNLDGVRPGLTPERSAS